MKIAGIIAEFNPFHNGHKHLIEEIKKAGYTHIVCAMSPNFVQRGDVAVFDKWHRSAIALANGVDLIVEIPTPYALSCGERFAKCGVFLLDSLQCVEVLAFGSESGNLEHLREICKIEEKIEFKNAIRQNLKEGKSYPRSFSEALDKMVGEGENLLTPNNILAVEYIKALENAKSTMRPTTFLRIGTTHDDEKTTSTIASASFIRRNLRNGNCQEMKKFAPRESLCGEIHRIKDEALLSILRCRSKEYYSMLFDARDGLGERIYDAVQKSCTMDEIFARTKSKCHTGARINRILLNAFLDIDQTASEDKPGFIKILGFNKKGKEILSKAHSTNLSIPIVTSVKKAQDLSIKAKKQAQTEVLATNLFNVLADKVKPCGEEFWHEVVKVGI